MTIGPASSPYRGVRGVDKYGSGTFGASRDGGARMHLGRDYIALPGDEALFPIHGVIERNGVAYAGSTLGSIHIRGTGEHQGLTMKVLYVDCDHPVGYIGTPGTRLGVVQSLQSKYPGITNHIHCELMVATDPESLMQHGEVHQ